MSYYSYSDPWGSSSAFGLTDSTAFDFIFIAIFVIVIGGFIYAIVSGISKWNKNNDSPVLTVTAKVVAKRHEVWGGSGDSRSRTSYYVTFQVESGDRMELEMEGSEFGMLAEGDQGRLTFQGTRYKEFVRQ